MMAGRKYADYLCDVCSQRIGQRGFVVLFRGFVELAKCRAHGDVRLPGFIR